MIFFVYQMDEHLLMGGPFLKCARLNNRTIHLHTYSREHYQFLFEEAQKGNIFCAHCEQPVLMRLSILEQPAFYHRQKGDFTACEKACAAEEPLAEKEKEEYKEAGMFRLPKGKAISENPKPIVSEWKSPKKFLRPNRFHQHPRRLIHLCSPASA